MYRTRRSELRYIKDRKLQNDCALCNLPNEQIIGIHNDFLVIKNIYGYDIWDRRKVIDHLMIVSKSHASDFNGLHKKSLKEYLKLLIEYSLSGYDLFTRASQSAMKTQPHFHTHLIKPDGNIFNVIKFNCEPYSLTFR